MLKERDNDVLSEELRYKVISHVPIKYLIVTQEPRRKEESGELCLETLYILKEHCKNKSGIELPDYIRNTDYLGIIYPSGRTEYKKVRGVKFEVEHRQIIFYVP